MKAMKKKKLQIIQSFMCIGVLSACMSVNILYIPGAREARRMHQIS